MRLRLGCFDALIERQGAAESSRSKESGLQKQADLDDEANGQRVARTDIVRDCFKRNRDHVHAPSSTVCLVC